MLRKDGADPAAAFVHRKKVQHAEKNIRDAFMALYRGLELLKKFRCITRPPYTTLLSEPILTHLDHHIQRPETKGFNASNLIYSTL